MSDAIHRDDIPYDIAEAVVKQLKELHPSCRVRFAGDAPADSDEHQRAIEVRRKLDEVFSAKLKEGVCMDCGEKYPVSWPPHESDELADGWVVLSDVACGEPAEDEHPGINTLGTRVVGIMCPNCDSVNGAD